MFRSPRSNSAPRALIIALVLGVPGARADEARLEPHGEVVPAPSGVVVRLTLQNVGTLPARDVRIEGSLDGARGRADIAGVLAPGARAETVMRLGAARPDDGAHVLVLRLDYESVRRDGRRFPGSRWVPVPLVFGAEAAGPAAPAVRLDLPSVRLARASRLEVGLHSEDGCAHRVRLEVFAPRGFGSVPFRQTVDVPTTGRALATVRLLRSSDPDEDAVVLAVAATEGEAPQTTAVATAPAEVVDRPDVLPRLRGWLVVAAVVLSAWSAFAQGRSPSAH